MYRYRPVCKQARFRKQVTNPVAISGAEPLIVWPEWISENCNTSLRKKEVHKHTTTLYEFLTTGRKNRMQQSRQDIAHPQHDNCTQYGRPFKSTCGWSAAWSVPLVWCCCRGASPSGTQTADALINVVFHGLASLFYKKEMFSHKYCLPQLLLSTYSVVPLINM